MSGIWVYLLLFLVLFGIPGAALIWFTVSLILFRRAKEHAPEKRRFRMIMLIVSAVCLAVLVAVIGSITGITALAIAHM